MIGATRFMQPGVFAVTRRFGDLQKVIMICMSNVEGCRTQQDREHDEAHRREGGRTRGPTNTRRSKFGLCTKKNGTIGNRRNAICVGLFSKFGKFTRPFRSLRFIRRDHLTKKFFHTSEGQ